MDSAPGHLVGRFFLIAGGFVFAEVAHFLTAHRHVPETYRDIRDTTAVSVGMVLLAIAVAQSY